MIEQTHASIRSGDRGAGEGAARAAADCTDADPVVKVDRRRAARIEYTNPFLIALLRRPKMPDAAVSVLSQAAAGGVAHAAVPDREREQADSSDDLAPVRGIVFGLLAVIPFWAGVAELWWLFHR